MIITKETDMVGIKINDSETTLGYFPEFHVFKRLSLVQKGYVKNYRARIEIDSDKDLVKQFSELENKALSVPPTLAFCLLTNKCNMNCSFCYANKNTDDYSGKFDVEWVRFLKKKLPPSSFAKCNFSGGEPLLEFDIVKELRKEFQDVIIYTNGSLIDEDMVKWFIDTNTKIYVSIDFEIEGYEGHDSVQVRKNLEDLSEKYPKFKELMMISVVVPASCMKNLSELRKQSGEFQKDVVHEFNFASGGIDVKDIEAEVKRLEDEEIGWKESMFLRYFRNFGFAYTCGMNPISCDPTINLSYRGDLYMCHEYASQSSMSKCVEDRVKLCHVKDFTFEKYFDKVKGRTMGACPKDCVSKWFCGNICWANLRYNEYLCELSKKITPYVFYLMENYSPGTNLEFRFDGSSIKKVSLRSIDEPKKEVDLTS